MLLLLPLEGGQLPAEHRCHCVLTRPASRLNVQPLRVRSVAPLEAAVHKERVLPVARPPADDRTGQGDRRGWAREE